MAGKRLHVALEGLQSCRCPPKSVVAYALIMKKAPVPCETGALVGAGEMNRTPDLLITNELLYRLSYTGLF